MRLGPSAAEIGAVNQSFARIEQIKRFASPERALSEGEGGLTPTMKVKREVILTRYGEVLRRLYGVERPAAAGLRRLPAPGGR